MVECGLLKPVMEEAQYYEGSIHLCSTKITFEEIGLVCNKVIVFVFSIDEVKIIWCLY